MKSANLKNVTELCYNIVENIFKENKSQEDRAEQSILFSCREYLATYQESCGTPRSEYSFAALIIVMAQATIRSLLALIYMIVNIGPIVQVIIVCLEILCVGKPKVKD